MEEKKHLDERQNDVAGSDKTAVPEYSKQSTERANRAAHEYFANGKSFRQAMVSAGYTQNVADAGLKFNLEHSVGLRRAFEQASKQHLRPDQLKKIAIHRLAETMADRSDTDGIRAIEVLGKMKDFDWFVRSTEMNLGMFVSLTEDTQNESVDTLKE